MTDYVKNIRNSGLSIYDHIRYDDAHLYIPTVILEEILSNALTGLSFKDLPLRSRSKAVKTEICLALGYPIPSSFTMTHSRFPEQNFDVYAQKSLNVQIWNEDLDPYRRYVFIYLNGSDVITSVRVIIGKELTKYAHNRTLTHKYQAKMKIYNQSFCSIQDTPNVENWIENNHPTLRNANPNQLPKNNQLLRISDIYERLIPMIGNTLDYLSASQERNRGSELHAMICDYLGYSFYEDDGSYPDITHQLLEIKLQTSSTIDLGQHSPEDGEEILSIGNTCFYSEDIRYAIFYGKVQSNHILLKNLYLVTGLDFSRYFPLFKGKQINSKIQFHLPKNFFN